MRVRYMVAEIIRDDIKYFSWLWVWRKYTFNGAQYKDMIHFFAMALIEAIKTIWAY